MNSEMPDADDSPTRLSARPAVWMISSAFGFAVMSTLSYGLRDRCDWSAIAAIRAAFMFLIVSALGWRAGIKPAVWRPGTLWMRSLAGSFGLLCNFYALTILPTSDVLTITNTSPLWIALLSWGWLKQELTWVDAAGVLLGIVGVALIQQPHLGHGGLAATAALASSFSTAIAMIGLHRLKSVDPRVVVAHFAAVASLAALAWLAWRWEIVRAGRFDIVTWLMLGGVSLSGAIAQLLLTKAYASGPPTRLSVLGLTQVVFAAGFDLWIWRRAFPSATLWGFVLVLAPTAWMLTHSLRALKPQPEEAL